MKICKMPEQLTLFGNASIANSFLERFRGLLGRREIDMQEALVFPKCNCVHTLGMKTEIDLLFLDDKMKIIKMTHRLKPNRVSGMIRAKTVVEVGPGACVDKQLNINDVLSFLECNK